MPFKRKIKEREAPKRSTRKVLTALQRVGGYGLSRCGKSRAQLMKRRV